MARKARWTDPERAAIRAAFMTGRQAGLTEKQIIAVVAESLPRRTEAAVRQEAWRLGIVLPAGHARARASRAEQNRKPQAPPAPRRAPRCCLMCRRSFQPDGRFDFVCDPCQASPAWRYGTACA